MQFTAEQLSLLMRLTDAAWKAGGVMPAFTQAEKVGLCGLNMDIRSCLHSIKVPVTVEETN